MRGEIRVKEELRFLQVDKGRRLYFLDNLKWFIIWLMVVFHAAMCYMAYAPEWWYVVDKADPSFGATAFVCWADVFIMPTMFFVSGYFGLRSLAHYDLGSFWRGKLRRIIGPWLFGAACIAPLVTYITLASRNSPMGFYEFYTTLFWGVFYQQAQYWYLGALTALYVLLMAACQALPSLKERREAGVPGIAFFLGLFAVCAISIGLVSSYMHPDTWKYFAYILVLQPVRIVSYIAVFFAGAWAWKKRWFEAGGYCPSAGRWGLPFLLTGGIYLWQKLFLAAYGLEAWQTVWVGAVMQAAFTCTALFFLLGLFRQCFDSTNGILSELSSTSYAVYYLHMPVLFPVAWAFVGIGMGVGMKYLSVCVLTLGLCFLLGKYVLKRLPSF